MIHRANTSSHRSPTSLLLTTLLVISLSGCIQMGPDLIKAGRNDYNKVLAQTNDEELLLNLVRLRYADAPVFLDVTSVSTSFIWNQGIEGNAFKFEPTSSSNRIGIGATLDYTERPTITYTPLGGADFVQNVLTPVKLDSLLLLSRSGWSIERLLRIMVNRMNGQENARKASGPTPADAPVYKDFLIAAQAFRELQASRAITLGYRKIGGEVIPAIRLEREARHSKALKTLAGLLGLDARSKIFTIDLKARLPRSNAIGVELRSLVGIMFFLSHAVEVPEQDLDAGRVAVTHDKNGQPFDWNLVVGDLLHIRSLKETPQNAAVAVQYRGSWFYIDDSDISSKYTFMLLRTLTALQAGKIQRAGPILTLPIAGP
jgi:hypothetical protein